MCIGGKSAILLAIQICLGSRAHDTSRGSSLAKLVRTDAEYVSTTCPPLHCIVLLWYIALNDSFMCYCHK
jgi:hypothetical protein